jgi:outer membrane protein assembly factor BamB
MKKLLALASVLLTFAVAMSQDEVRLHTNPKAPPKDVLEKLNLKQTWHIKVPVDGLRDGFYSLQLIPGPKFTLLLAQTYQGAVVAINADTGNTLWRTSVGLAYQAAQPAGWNDRAIFVCRRDTLFVLDRDTGKQQLFTVEPDGNQPVYGMGLEGAPSAGLVADEGFLYVCLSDRAVRYYVPNFRGAFEQQERVAQPGKKLPESPQVIRTWSFNAYGPLLQTPILNREMLVLITADGVVLTVNKYEEKPEKPVSRFLTEGAIPAPVAFNKSIVYVPCEDYFLYAIDTATGRLVWRFSGQSPINKKPEATDRDVFVTPSKGGMVRVNRKTGDAVWQNKGAFQFLATNERFVYVLDKQGKMLVLDHERGKELARYDLRDWVLPIANDATDRIYLASNDGQIICLHHRDFAKPLKVKTFEELKSVKEKKENGEPKDKEKPKDDKDKEDKDKDDKDKGDKDKMSQAPLWQRMLPLGLEVPVVFHSRMMARPEASGELRLFARDALARTYPGISAWSAGG